MTGNSASKYKIISFNCNSIGKNPKRSQVLQYLRNKKPDILILVDTRISKDIECQVKEEWNGYTFFSSFSSQARGIAILLRKDLPIKIKDSFCDQAGNIAAVLVEMEEKLVLIEGIYGPNEDSPQFYSEEVFKRIQDWNPTFSVHAGDWNIVLDSELDCKGYQNINNPRAREELIKKMEEHELLDAFREMNPGKRMFSWKRWGSLKFARLDYFLISNSLLPYVQNVDILPALYSDHGPILLEIDFSRFQRGKGFWKFNNSLLGDPTYVQIARKTIKEAVYQYTQRDYNVNNEDHYQIIDSLTPEALQALPVTINPELFLDTLLLNIRGNTIKYSAFKKRNRLEKERQLMHDIETLERRLPEMTSDDTDLVTELDEKKVALEEINNDTAQGAYVRSRATYKVEGERPTKMFCELEKYNGVQKFVPQLIVEDEEQGAKTVRNQKGVEYEILSFYRQLYKNKDEEIQLATIENFLGNNSYMKTTKLTESEKHSMEGEITVLELTNYLKKTKNNVSPGSSDYINEFFNSFGGT